MKATLVWPVDHLNSLIYCRLQAPFSKSTVYLTFGVQVVCEILCWKRNLVICKNKSPIRKYSSKGKNVQTFAWINLKMFFIKGTIFQCILVMWNFATEPQIISAFDIFVGNDNFRIALLLCSIFLTISTFQIMKRIDKDEKNKERSYGTVP